jgi:hypothetical protein
VAIELGMNAHVDGLGVLLLVAALSAAERGRRAAAGAWLALATAVKLLPALLAPAVVRGRRAAVTALAALVLVSAPYLLGGAPLVPSLGEYARRWRANDGAFALLDRGARAALAPTRWSAPVRPGPRLARLISGRDRDEVYPDEAAGLLARATALVLCLGAIALALFARAAPLVVAEVGLGAFLLLSPTLHPWYVLWILPLAAVGAHPAWSLLAALVPLAYLPADPASLGPVWPRLVEHGLVWAWLLASLSGPRVMRRIRRYSLTRRELKVTCSS